MGVKFDAKARKRDMLATVSKRLAAVGQKGNKVMIKGDDPSDRQRTVASSSHSLD